MRPSHSSLLFITMSAASSSFPHLLLNFFIVILSVHCCLLVMPRIILIHLWGNFASSTVVQQTVRPKLYPSYTGYRFYDSCCHQSTVLTLITKRYVSLKENVIKLVTERLVIWLALNSQSRSQQDLLPTMMQYTHGMTSDLSLLKLITCIHHRKYLNDSSVSLIVVAVLAHCSSCSCTLLSCSCTLLP